MFEPESDGAAKATSSAAAATPVSFSPGTGHRVQLFAVAIAIILLAGFALIEALHAYDHSELASTTKQEQASAPVVDVVRAASPPGETSLTLPGESAAWYASTIYARVPGYVATWLVDIGDTVHAGQVLATIDTPDLDAQLSAAEAKLKATQAEVEVKEAQADFARTTYDRWKSAPKGVVSEQEREDKKAGFASAQAELAASRAQVNLEQADVDRLSAFETFKQVTAPFDGTIVERRVDIGDLVTAGSSSGTSPLYKMDKDDPIRIFVDVPQAAAADIKVGAPAVITANTLNGRQLQGKVTRTADAIDPVARTLKVEVDLPNKDKKLVPGTYVEVAFEIPPEGKVRVPAAAVLFRSAGPQVAVVDKDDTVHLKDVTIARDEGNVVDLASGVKPGDTIVLNLSSQIADGSKVTVDDQTDEVADTGAQKS